MVAMQQQQQRQQCKLLLMMPVVAKRCSTTKFSCHSSTKHLSLCTNHHLSSAAASSNAGSNALAAVSSSLNRDVFVTSLGASLNLVSAIGLVAWMQRSGYLPAETPVVLSQVAFRITIPCYLMTKVASTLAVHRDANIFLLPFIALFQVFLGAGLGTLLCSLLLKKGSSPKTRLKRKALVISACAFGNTLALPLVFLSGMLTPADASLSAGCIALFMIGWSPTLWTVAYNILSTVGGGADDRKASSFKELVETWAKRILNPPLCGVLVGTLIGLTPVSYILLPQRSSNAALSRLLASIYEAAVFLGSAAPSLQLTVLACSLAGVMRSRKAKLPQLWGPRKIKATAQESSLLKHDERNDERILGNREFLVVYLVRSLFLPAVFSLSISALRRMELVKLSSVSLLSLQMLSAMPSAQNLVLLAQLRPSTRPFAKEFAGLLLKQYAAALAPVTLWSAVFLSTSNTGG